MASAPTNQEIKSFVCPRNFPNYCPKDSKMRKTNDNNQCAVLRVSCDADHSGRKFIPEFKECELDDKVRTIKDLDWGLSRVCQESDIKKYNRAHGTNYTTRSMLGYYDHEFNKDGLKDKLNRKVLKESIQTMKDSVNQERKHRRSSKGELTKEEIQTAFPDFDTDYKAAHNELDQEKLEKETEKIHAIFRAWIQGEFPKMIANHYQYDDLKTALSDPRKLIEISKKLQRDFVHIFSEFATKQLGMFRYGAGEFEIENYTDFSEKEWSKWIKIAISNLYAGMYQYFDQLFKLKKIEIEANIDKFETIQECAILKEYLMKHIEMISSGDHETILTLQNQFGSKNYQFLSKFVRNSSEVLTCK